MVSVGMDGEAKLRAEWKRDEPLNHEKLRNRKGGIPLLRDADVAVPARNLKQDAGGAGAYIVAHAAECQVANMSAYNLTGIITKMKLPPLRKIEFIACHAAQKDEEAQDNPQMRDIRLKSDEGTPKSDQWVHGLDSKELSFITQFCCLYGESLEDPREVKVAGWDCFVSVAHPKKEAKEMPKMEGGYNPAMTGKKFIRQGGPPTFPRKASHHRSKKMFRWVVTGERESVVTAIERAEWSDKAA